jgi:DNA mismatch repair protein MutS
VKKNKNFKSRCAVAVAKGNAIAKGVNAELDELRAISTSGKNFRELKQESQTEQDYFFENFFNNVLVIISLKYA